MATASVVSNEGALASASAVLLIVASNEDYNQRALRIDQAGKGGGAAPSRSTTRIPTAHPPSSTGSERDPLAERHQELNDQQPRRMLHGCSMEITGCHLDRISIRR